MGCQLSWLEREIDRTCRRLPSIRELELSCSTSAAFAEPTSFSPYALSPTYSQFPSPPALTPSSSAGTRHLSNGDEQGSRSLGQRRTSAGDCHDLPVERSPSVLAQDMPPEYRRNESMIGHRFGDAPMRHAYQPSARHAPHFGHQPPSLPANSAGNMRLDLSIDKQPFLTTPPRSPDRTPLAAPPQSSQGLAAAQSEVSSSSTDDAIAETRRQRRESKERRRRRDQRSLTVCMEQSVPSWVFSRLKTRHSASKVNGGGRATNAVISGACIWLRVLDRAMQENVPHWTTQTKTIHGDPAMDRWLQFVDEEAATLENWDLGDDDSGPGTNGSMDLC